MAFLRLHKILAYLGDNSRKQICCVRTETREDLLPLSLCAKLLILYGVTKSRAINFGRQKSNNESHTK
jgi:hypothetical protein